MYLNLFIFYNKYNDIFKTLFSKRTSLGIIPEFPVAQSSTNYTLVSYTNDIMMV